MALDANFEKALRSSDPFGELRRLAQQALDKGCEVATVREQFEHARQQLRDAAREDDEDVVMEVLDCLWGWCSPHLRLGAQDSGGAA